MSTRKDLQHYPYMNASLPVEERVADLLSRMSLEEKVRQLDIYSGNEISDSVEGLNADALNYEKMEKVSAGIGIGCIQNRNSKAETANKIQEYIIQNSRLGIPVLFSEEGLHGFGWRGCTVLPQQVALASTFEPELGYKQARIIASEARSFGIHEVWAPVLDLAREIRWGRVEEGYGEDPYLGSLFAESMVKGLQTDDLTRPDAVVSEPKHFTGYGAPRGGHNCAPAMMGQFDNAFFCLPVFEAAFQAGAMNTMCSYNSIDGVPVAGDHSLLTGVLRDKWGMKGFVRSDMTAVSMLHTCHYVAESKREAIKMGLEAGVDMQLYDFPHDIYQDSIIDLVKSGEVDEKVVDTAAGRVLTVKFAVGLFENPYTDTELSSKVVHCEEHVQTALEIARKSITLLKNSKNTLPLKKDIGKIAVIGPSADVPRYGDYSSPVVPEHAVTLLQGIKNIVSDKTELIYAKGCEILESDLMPLPDKWLKDHAGNDGLLGEYYNSLSFEGEPACVRNDRQINFNWIYTKPADGVNADNFTVRWTGKIKPDVTVDGYIGLSSMDSMRLWVDGKMLVDGWGDHDANQMVAFQFVKGEEYDVKVEYLNDSRGVRVILGYSLGNNDMDAAVKAAEAADVAIVAVGDNEQTSGENLDRADLNLPGRQLELVKKIYETGTPVVLVLQNGRPLSITWEAEHLDAIIEAWFVGEQGGNAMAEVIFGDVNPAGRIPMSFPRSVGQLPVFYNRRPFYGHKYVEMDWLPLYPFGFGLSYTTFAYSDLDISAKEIAPDGEVNVSFNVTNTGAVAGEEVAQLYIRDEFSSTVRPCKELAGFKRIHLEKGETKRITLTLGYRQLRTLTRNYEWVVEPGKFEVMVGPNSDDAPLTGEFFVRK
ncbi:glycoside hydrolase family 3 C-terminal domain-containing protein [Paenibacillus sp. NPDC058910]|uniref:glycoside hydrolase family 3 C-terminal domain-containing protein n=1 Tax=unclassified Paenibacillus TaxID=185978 RepID=UPI0036B07FBE